MSTQNVCTPLVPSGVADGAGRVDTERRSILIVEADPVMAERITGFLAADEVLWLTVHVATLAAARAALLDFEAPPDCILLDLSLSDATGLEGLVVLGVAAPDTAIVVLADDCREQMAVAALTEGAQDLLSKRTLDPATLSHVLARARQRASSSDRAHSNTRLVRSILDTIEAPTAALDGRGEIVLTNATWRSSAAMGGVSPTSVGPGINYLGVCDRVEGPEVADARDAAAGIRAVLSGANDLFTLDYPCHTPTDQRWFCLRVVPLGALGGGAVVSHLDITQEKRAEMALRDGRRDIGDPDHGVGQLYLVLDDDARVVASSDFTQQLLGAKIAEVVGSALSEWLHPGDVDACESAHRAALARPGGSAEVKVRMRDAASLWHVVDLVLLNRMADERVHGIVVTGSDVTPAEHAAFRARLGPELLERLPSAVLVADDVGMLVYWNPAAAEIFGIGTTEVARADLTTLLDGTRNSPHARLVAEELRVRGCWQGALEVCGPDGTPAVVRASFDRLDLPDLGFRGLLGTAAAADDDRFLGARR